MAIVNLRNTTLTVTLVDMANKTFEEVEITIPGNRTQRNNASIRAALHEAHEAGRLTASPDAPYEITSTEYGNEWFKVSDDIVRKYGEPYQPTTRERKPKDEDKDEGKPAPKPKGEK